MARYKVKIQTTTESGAYIEAETVEIAIYKTENENISEISGTNETTSKKVVAISLIEETETEQELPSSD